MTPGLTIAVAARNAAATIARAIASCVPETHARLLLIDDHSTDDTVAIARSIAGHQLHVVSTPDPGGVSLARQTGLDVVETEFTAWLDADDEWVPGRADRLSAMLSDGYDVATEAIDLCDGATGGRLKQLTVPAFLRRPGTAVRLFERNVLPGDTQVAFRTDAYRAAGGYDTAIIGPESFDLLLRALRQGARIAFGDDAGYRMYAYPGSVSRQVDRQSAAIAATLRKHEYADIERLYSEAGYDERVTAWGLVSMALFRNEPLPALRFLAAASPDGADPEEVLEPEGPWPMREGWRGAFTRGTLLLMLGGRDREAEDELRRAESLEQTPEGANNLGVALARRGDDAAAREQFALAATRFRGYYDARLNAGADAPGRITTHPLRRAPSRNDYR